MKCSGVWPSGTAYITFEDVKVPKENLVGKENKGFKYIMWNFSSERLGIVIQANRFARVCIEESTKVNRTGVVSDCRYVINMLIEMLVCQQTKDIWKKAY